MADISFSLFGGGTTGQQEMIVDESVPADGDNLPYCNNQEGGDDDNGTDICIFSPLAFLSHPPIGKARESTILSSRHSFISLYLLYGSLIFYHATPRA